MLVVLEGLDGAGKSTLLRCTVGLEQIDGGEVLLDGEIVCRAAKAQKRKITAQIIETSFMSTPSKYLSTASFPSFPAFPSWVPLSPPQDSGLPVPS